MGPSPKKIGTSVKHTAYRISLTEVAGSGSRPQVYPTSRRMASLNAAAPPAS